jgi:16S rRNA (cytosine967-C5)-methyltransferase
MSVRGPARSGLAPARACAYRVIRRVFEGGAYADRALDAEARAAGLDQRDRSLAMQLAYGAVQRRATLDHVIDQLASRPATKLDQPVLSALRLGLFQLLFLDGIAPHAAVNEAVEAVRAEGSHGGGLVNAVLRRAARDGGTLLGDLDDHDPDSAAVMHSVPVWLARKWWEELGAEEARRLLAQVNEPPESAIRVNTLRSTPAEVAQRLPVGSRAAPPLADIPLDEGLVLDGPFDVASSPLYREGAVMAQSRGSMLVARMLDPRPGERVLDLCAAPGGKTTHIAARLGGEGEVVAVERNPKRARALSETCERMGAQCVRIEVADARNAAPGPQFDRVLVDPPCSGLGTLQSRPDIRWRARPEAIAELGSLQDEILASAATVTAPGGRLVYSVCTISRPEGAEVIDRFLQRHRGFSVERSVQTLPHRDGTDGFFLTSLRRGAG